MPNHTVVITTEFTYDHDAAFNWQDVFEEHDWDKHGVKSMTVRTVQVCLSKDEINERFGRFLSDCDKKVRTVRCLLVKTALAEFNVSKSSDLQAADREPAWNRLQDLRNSI